MIRKYRIKCSFIGFLYSLEKLILFCIVFLCISKFMIVYGSSEECVHIDEIYAIGKVNIGQDGAIYDNSLFHFTSNGECYIYDIETLKLRNRYFLDKKELLNPHSNSVCFGKNFYAPSDPYPAIYCNIYNNYNDSNDKKLGTCCVYRLFDNYSQLVQVLKIGFIDETNLWADAEDYRPYGNFIVDTDNDFLYVYTMKDDSNSVRFFKFDIPSLDSGVFDPLYGCNILTLEKDDMINMFDIPYTYLIQGACYYQGKMFSLEGGLGYGKIRIIDLLQEKVLMEYNLHDDIVKTEPEMIDQKNGLFYYIDSKGNVSKFSLLYNHNWDEGQIEIEPTFKNDGIIKYLCSNCLAEKLEEIPKIPPIIVSNGEYILSDDKTYAIFVKSINKYVRNLNIQNIITYDHVNYFVKEIAENACNGDVLLENVKIGCMINTIGKNAFKGCRNLQKIVIYNKKFKSIKIGENAFENISSDVIIYFFSNQQNNYMDILKKGGISSSSSYKFLLGM